MREKIVVFLGSMAIVTGGYAFGWWEGSKPKPPLPPYSPKSCYLVESAFTKMIADTWETKRDCVVFSLREREIGYLCGPVDILNVAPKNCQDIVKERDNPSLPEEEKKG